MEEEARTTAKQMAKPPLSHISTDGLHENRGHNWGGKTQISTPNDVKTPFNTKGTLGRGKKSPFFNPSD